MSLLEKMKALREQYDAELDELENKIADEEHEYLTCETSQLGNVLKGFEGFLSSKETIRKRSRQHLKYEERLFSLSSRTSQITKDYDQQLLSMEQAMEPMVLHGAPPKKMHPQKVVSQKRKTDGIEKPYAKKTRRVSNPV